MIGLRRLIAVAIVLGVAPSSAWATAIPIGSDAFGAGSTLTTFDGLAIGTEVNGLTVDGITFSYSLGNGGVAIGYWPWHDQQHCSTRCCVRLEAL